MYSVHTGTYLLMTLKYVPGTYFFPRVCTQKYTFLISLYLVYTGTYLRKKVCTEYILREKSMYQVHTGLCPFISVPYYSMVHTGMYRYVLGTYHCSRFQMAPPVTRRGVCRREWSRSLPSPSGPSCRPGPPRGWKLPPTG